MKTIGFDTFEIPAGWRNLSFLRITTDSDIVGWSEYPENNVNRVLTPLVRSLAERVKGEDPRNVQRIVDGLRSATRGVPAGAVHRAIAAIENALVDIKAKALGIPVYELLGGACRDSIPLYWSHCGSFHVTHAKELGVAPVRSLADLTALGRDVRESGFSALKTNLIVFDPVRGAYLYRPGFVGGPGDPDRNPSRVAADAAVKQMLAFRRGAGPDVGLKLDINFNFRTEGLLRMARALELVDLEWLEVDNFDPEALGQVRRGSTTPIASGEAVMGRRQLRPFLEARAVDVVIIDVAWNGILEAMRMAALADTYELNVAIHNFSGGIASLMSGHFAMAVPNLRIMEMDGVQVPWMYDMVTQAPVVRAGRMKPPTGSGWGAEIDVERAESIRAQSN